MRFEFLMSILIKTYMDYVISCLSNRFSAHPQYSVVYELIQASISKYEYNLNIDSFNPPWGIADRDWIVSTVVVSYRMIFSDIAKEGGYDYPIHQVSFYIVITYIGGVGN
jgi:hypothetical protein